MQINSSTEASHSSGVGLSTWTSFYWTRVDTAEHLFLWHEVLHNETNFSKSEEYQKRGEVLVRGGKRKPNFNGVIHLWYVQTADSWCLFIWVFRILEINSTILFNIEHATLGLQKIDWRARGDGVSWLPLVATPLLQMQTLSVNSIAQYVSGFKM